MECRVYNIVLFNALHIYTKYMFNKYIYLNKFIYFIYFRLHWVFVAARGLFSSCGVQASHWWSTGSRRAGLVVARGL